MKKSVLEIFQRNHSVCCIDFKLTLPAKPTEEYLRCLHPFPTLREGGGRGRVPSPHPYTRGMGENRSRTFRPQMWLFWPYRLTGHPPPSLQVWTPLWNRFFRCFRWFGAKKKILFWYKKFFWTCKIKFFGYFELYATQAPPLKSIFSMFQMIWNKKRKFRY